MKKIYLNIEIHQPLRLETYRFFEIMNNHFYYDDYENEYYMDKISGKFYMPANRILLDLIKFSENSFKVSFLFSGVGLDQLELYAPQLLDSYKTLADTGSVGLLSGTYSNTLGPLLNKKEYDNQVKLQKARIKSVFGIHPVAYPVRNYYNYHCGLVSPCLNIFTGEGVLNKNISYRVNPNIDNDWFLKPEKLLKLLNTYGKDGYNRFNLFIPYDFFGESQNYSGILEFLEGFPALILSKSDFSFELPSGTDSDFRSGLLSEFPPEISDHHYKMFGSTLNEMQIDAFEKLYSYSGKVEVCNDPSIGKDWLYLQTCDHFYYMNPLLYEEKEFHNPFLPYKSHFFAYINYMNILSDFSDRLDKWIGESDKDKNGLSENRSGSEKNFES
jgi:alpha-amylase